MGQSGHESVFVRGEKCVLAVISFEPTIDEMLIQINRMEVVPAHQGLFYVWQHLPDHGEENGLLGE